MTFARLQLVGWAGYAALMIVSFLPFADVEGGVAMLVHLKVAHAAQGLLASSALALVYRRVQRRAPAVVAGALVLGLAWALAGLAYAWLIGVSLDVPAERAYFPRRVLEDAVVLAGWSALYFAIRERERARRAELGETQARLAALRQQLHPHFLFNALNAIRALVDEDPVKARAMITGVAELLRHALQAASTVALGEELAIVRAYLEVEQVRFEDQLVVTVEVPEALQAASVPGFVVMPLVENAIKHGFAPGAPLQIAIRAQAEPLRLEVANTGVWRAGPESGLANLRARLADAGGTLAIAPRDGWVHAVITL